MGSSPDDDLLVVTTQVSNADLEQKPVTVLNNVQTINECCRNSQELAVRFLTDDEEPFVKERTVYI